MAPRRVPAAPRRRSPAAWLGAALLAGCATAGAAPAPLTHHGFSSAGWSAVTVGSPFGGGSVSAAAGAFSVTWGGQSFLTYCLELTQYAAVGQTHDYTLMDGVTYFDTLVPELAARGGSGAVVVDRLDRLFTALGGAMLPSGAQLGAPLSTPAQATAALQLAIWELVYEGYGGGAPLAGTTLASGAFAETSGRRTAGQLVGHANTLLSAAAQVAEGQYQISVLYSPQFQDYLVVTPRPARRDDGRSVPLPGTLALAALGLCAAAVARRRRG